MDPFFSIWITSRFWLIVSLLRLEEGESPADGVLIRFMICDPSQVGLYKPTAIWCQQVLTAPRELYIKMFSGSRITLCVIDLLDISFRLIGSCPVKASTRSEAIYRDLLLCM